MAYLDDATDRTILRHRPPAGRPRIASPSACRCATRGAARACSCSVAVHVLIIGLLIVPFFLPDIGDRAHASRARAERGRPAVAVEDAAARAAARWRRCATCGSRPIRCPRPRRCPPVPTPCRQPKVEPPKPAPVETARAAGAGAAERGARAAERRSRPATPGRGRRHGERRYGGRGSGQRRRRRLRRSARGGGARTVRAPAGATQANYPPQAIEFFLPPMPPPKSVRGFTFVARVRRRLDRRVCWTSSSTRRRDGGYNRRIAERAARACASARARAPTARRCA